jgi:purine catabolism regulator
VAARVRSFLADQRGRISASLTDNELAIVLASNASHSADWRDLTTMLRGVRAQDESAVLVLSEQVRGPSHAHEALEQARSLARLVGAGVIGGPALRADAVDRTGLHGLLLPFVIGGVVDPTGVRARLKAFASALLAPLEEHDVRRGSELVTTLDVYLQLGGALAQAAERLDIHRNTLSYRLGRIAELTGRDLNDPRTRFLLQVALGIRSLEHALEPH